MYVYVCRYKFLYRYIFTHVYLCDEFINICLYMDMDKNIYIHIHKYTYLCMCIHLFIYVCVYIHPHIYIHMYADKDYEIAFRDEQARSVMEARTQKYISKVTSDNLDIIDPTGRASLVDIQPSHITVCSYISLCTYNTYVCMYENLK
jgi:hypothetical protein